MGTYTFNASTGNFGYIFSYSTSYSAAREGTGTLSANTTGTEGVSGQFYITATGVRGVYQTFIEFDTSSLSGKTISTAVLKIYPTTTTTDDTYTLEARLDDFSTSVTTADFVKGSLLSGKTLLATLASTSAGTGAYRSFTDTAFPANVNTSGKTRIVIASDQQRLNSGPGSNIYEYCIFQGSGAANPPQLVITTPDEGALTKTLGALTLSAAVSIETFGVVSATLGGISLSAAGLQTSAGTGVLDKTLGALTLSSAIGIETFGFAEITLGSLTLNTAALVPREGVVDQTLGALVLNGIAARDTTGSLSVTLGSLQLATSTQNGIQGALSVTLGAMTLVAAESVPPWPSVHGFPQSPLDGTWRPELGDDTLRSDREIGARQYRTRNGGNYKAASFAIMLTSKAQKTELDRFFVNDCASGTVPFTWEDPETGDIERWTWAAAPAFQHVARDHYRVECALRKEAA